MDIHEHLTNGILDVELRLPGSEPAWTRFDLSGLIPGYAARQASLLPAGTD